MKIDTYIYNVLSSADSNTLIGYAIHQQLTLQPGETEINAIIQRLHSQYIDNPELVKSIFSLDITSLFTSKHL